MNKPERADDLDAQRRLGGAELLKMVDALGFNASAAAWMRTAPGERWFYILATTMIDTHGPLWIYDRLMKVFGKIHLPEGITPLDIHIISPDEAFIQGIPFSSDSGTNSFYNNRMDGRLLPDMVVYRLIKTASQTASPAEQFNEQVNQLMAA